MITTLTASQLGEMEIRTRAQLASSLPGVKPVALIGTTNTSGQTNLAPFSSLVHLGSNPALLGMVTRPHIVDRHTLANIQETRHWTINHLTPSIFEQAHHCAARYPVETSEFDATGLTPHFEAGMPAPFVSESPFRIGMRLEDLIDIPANGTKLIVGHVSIIQLDGDSLHDDGSVDLVGLGLVASTALDTYYQIESLARLPYAKPRT